VYKWPDASPRVGIEICDVQNSSGCERTQQDFDVSAMGSADTFVAR
jgi:hypothetical protein